MILATTKAEVRERCDAARGAGAIVGLVPTMGAFHVGHRSLMHAARRACDIVVTSIFVNPLQFGAGEDLAAYPRDLDRDTALADAAGVDVLFVPSVEEMYPSPVRTTVHVDELTEDLCGAARPTHFDGVTTVVAKLFAIAGPCRAYFGKKDFQQLAVVRRMTADLDLPVEVIGCPIVREPDGLALSSRNVYLNADERPAATVLSKAVFWASETVVRGEREAAAVVAAARDVIATEPSVALEYAEVREARDLRAVDRLDGDIVVAVAARVGRARLIDNCSLTISGDDVAVDLGVVCHPPLPDGAPRVAS
jgi:pantoate--beta-alanine ligase